MIIPRFVISVFKTYVFKHVGEPHFSAEKGLRSYNPLLISTGFLKYPLRHLFHEKKFQYKLTDFFFQFSLKFFYSSNGYFKKPVEINRGL